MARGDLGLTEELGVYLVDDELPALRRMGRMVEEIEGCRVLGSNQSSDQALIECARLPVDVIFLDVEMPGLNGVELARRLKRLQPEPVLVFVTAFERYAVDAFDVAAVDYLVKPVRPERLAQAMDRARQACRLRAPEPVLQARLGERVMNIPLSRVRVLLAEDKYTSVHHVGGIALIDDSLVSLEQRFPRDLLRVHRNALVSQRHLRALLRDAEGTDRVELDDVECRPEVSRRQLPLVRRALKQSIAKECH
jgi:two-component system, LytTR family, response regulator AlgR